MGLSKEGWITLCKIMEGSLPLFRTKLGLSQEQLAVRLDVTRQTISVFESEQRKMPWNMLKSGLSPEPISVRIRFNYFSTLRIDSF